jgi:TM2 domain-containing membrane protein YozV
MSTALTRSERSIAISYVLLAVSLMGICGLHRFYLGRPWSGLLWLVTGGLCGVGSVIDLVLIPRMVVDANDDRPRW